MELDEAKPQYNISQPNSETTIVAERLLQPQSQQSPVPGRDGRSPSSASVKRSGNKGSRSGLITLQQQHLLKSHLDDIMDVAFLEVPYGMVVSADRSGVILIFM